MTVRHKGPHQIHSRGREGTASDAKKQRNDDTQDILGPIPERAEAQGVGDRAGDLGPVLEPRGLTELRNEKVGGEIARGLRVNLVEFGEDEELGGVLRGGIGELEGGPEGGDGVGYEEGFAWPRARSNCEKTRDGEEEQRATGRQPEKESMKDSERNFCDRRSIYAATVSCCGQMR
ncbi:hypothetical protein H6P81_018192 [Aristolochia fimbriata]|uniref:Uncharacterized protein n=1 Tax=Aristolochia fimbriata TaxID=158543 RepID=A0AAV7E4M6_ARIFI|nr:hypothetical protein H6P81_018192 [Aristolochia fimbriata]